MNVLYVSTPWEILLHFPSQERYMLWSQEVRRLKDRIAAINDDDNPGAARIPKYRRWIEQVRAFVRNFGEEMLPPDIKSAMNGVEEDIGVQRTVWADPPENHLA